MSQLGGGFAPRAVPPVRDWKGGNHLGRYPAVPAVKQRPVHAAAHAALVGALRGPPPEQR